MIFFQRTTHPNSTWHEKLVLCAVERRKISTDAPVFIATTTTTATATGQRRDALVFAFRDDDPHCLDKRIIRDKHFHRLSPYPNPRNISSLLRP